MRNSVRHGLRNRRRAIAAAVTVLMVLSGCGGGAARNAGLTPGEAARPVQLGRGLNANAGASVLMALNEPKVRRAITNYRINKKRAEGPYQLVGADLNSDGVAEAVVLFGGKDWCTRLGCSLAILQAGQHGYTPISRTVRVKAPVVIAREQTNGWRDLFVSTGGAGSAPLRRVRLRFSGSSYSRNAMLQEELPPDMPQIGETVFGEPPSPAAQLNGALRASNP